MPNVSSCPHASQKYSGYHGEWVCTSCEHVVKRQEFDPDKLESVKFGGLYAFKQMRNYGKTGREMAEENITKFRERKGYDPVSTKRWI